MQGRPTQGHPNHEANLPNAPSSPIRTTDLPREKDSPNDPESPLAANRPFPLSKDRYSQESPLAANRPFPLSKDHCIEQNFWIDIIEAEKFPGSSGGILTLWRRQYTFRVLMGTSQKLVSSGSQPWRLIARQARLVIQAMGVAIDRGALHP